MTRDGLCQRLQQGFGFTNPIRQSGAIQINALAVEYLALPVKQRMISVFIYQHMGNQPGPGSAPLDAPRGQGGLMERLAVCTGQTRAHDPVHHKISGDIFQFLGDILAQCS